MVLFVKDRTGRFAERPHYKQEELDFECERIIVDFLRELHDEVRYPIITDDLTKLIERDVDDLDLYADLEDGVEGVTEFLPGAKPRVRISGLLSSDPRLENRLRTTLTHEFGHVHFHAYLWETKGMEQNLFESDVHGEPVICKRDGIINAGTADWMEWQAGYVCGSLLMPITPLKRLVAEYSERENIVGSVVPESSHGQALIAVTVGAFQVSNEAARVRLLQQKFLGDFDAGPSLFA